MGVRIILIKASSPTHHSCKTKPTNSMSPRDRPASDSDESSSVSLPQHQHKKERKSVQFAAVKVREYNRIVGDHPDATSVPISIGWDFVEGPATPLDEYESTRPSRRRNLRLSTVTRKNLLVNVFQVDEKEISEADSKIKRIRRQRESSNKQGKIGAKVESALRSTKRKFRKTFFSTDELFQGFAAAASGMPMSEYTTTCSTL